MSDSFPESKLVWAALFRAIFQSKLSRKISYYACLCSLRLHPIDRGCFSSAIFLYSTRPIGWTDACYHQESLWEYRGGAASRWKTVNQRLRKVISDDSNSISVSFRITVWNSYRYDEAQLRFGRGSKLDEDFYVRQDGTCAYFFEIDRLQEQFRCVIWASNNAVLIDLDYRLVTSKGGRPGYGRRKIHSEAVRKQTAEEGEISRVDTCNFQERRYIYLAR